MFQIKSVTRVIINAIKLSFLISIIIISIPISSYATLSLLPGGQLVRDDMGTPLSQSDDMVWFRDLSAFKATYENQVNAIAQIGPFAGYSGFRMATYAEVLNLASDTNRQAVANLFIPTGSNEVMSWWWGRTEDWGTMQGPFGPISGHRAPELGSTISDLFFADYWYLPNSSDLVSAWVVGSPVAQLINIPMEKKSGDLLLNIEGNSFHFQYDLSFINNVLQADLNIKLVGEPVSEAYRNRWEYGIEEIWSNNFELSDGMNTYPLKFNVNWIPAGNVSDYIVNVTSGWNGQDKRYNTFTWYNDAPYDFIDKYAAHEAGHFIGLFDEYAGGTLNPYTGLIDEDAIMGSKRNVEERYYEPILNWLENKSQRDFFLVSANAPPYPFNENIENDHDGPIIPNVTPEPTAILLLGLGLVGLAGARRKFKK